MLAPSVPNSDAPPDPRPENRFPTPEGVVLTIRGTARRRNSQWTDWSSGPRATRYRTGMTCSGRRDCQVLLRKEVIQPHLPVRLPCYDFTPIADPTFDGSLHKGWATGFGCYPLSWCDGRCVQGPGTYSPQRADLRLLATPTSRSRVADCDPNCDRFFGISSPSRVCNPLYRPL